MFDAICEHIKYSYNEGAIRPAITIFRKRQQGLHDMRVWNQLMIAFAGYSVEGAKENQFSGDENTSRKIGDQSNVVFTRVSMLDKLFFDNIMRELYQNISYTELIYNIKSFVNDLGGKKRMVILSICPWFSLTMVNPNYMNFRRT